MKNGHTDHLVRGIPDALWKRLKVRAAREDKQLKALVVELLQKGLKHESTSGAAEKVG